MDFSLFLGAACAGLLGSLTGLGGGVIVVPFLVLLMGIDLHLAIGASLMAVIANSSVASTTFVKEGLIDFKIAIVLAAVTVIGASIGACFSPYCPRNVLMVLLSLSLVISIVIPLFRREDPQPFSRPLCYFLMLISGALSGLLGIGSGAMKVLVMDQGMQLPFKVSTATSNLMIGITAVASAGFYLRSGYIEPSLVSPVVLGTACGSLIGSRLMNRLELPILRTIFNCLVFFIAAELLFEGLYGF